MSKLFQEESVASSFSAAANRYDQHVRAQKQAETELLERIQLLNIQPKTILDIGTGTGELSRALKQLFPKADVFGIDLSPGMVEEAKSRNGWFKKISYQVADASALPFEEDAFDLVVSNFMLHWCNDIDAVFSEVNRVLKDDACMFMTCMGPDTLKEFRDIWGELDDKPHVHPFVDMHLIGDGLLRQGFRDPVIDREDCQVHFDSARDAIESLKQIGAQNRLAERRRTLTGKARMKAFFQRYDDLYRDQGYPLTYEIVYMHARGGKRLPNQGSPDTAYFSLEDLKQSLTKDDKP